MLKLYCTVTDVGGFGRTLLVTKPAGGPMRCELIATSSIMK